MNTFQISQVITDNELVRGTYEEGVWRVEYRWSKKGPWHDAAVGIKGYKVAYEIIGQLEKALGHYMNRERELNKARKAVTTWVEMYSPAEIQRRNDADAVVEPFQVQKNYEA